MVRQNRISRVAAGILCALLLLLSSHVSAGAVTTYDCEKNVHAYEVMIEKEAEETQDGIRRYTCALCGDTYDEVIPMYGHVYGEWTEETEPTCQEPGVRYRICVQHEHETEVRDTEEIPVTDHEYEEVRQEPGCEEEGLITYSCIWCDEVYTEELEATGHEYGKWITDKEATDSEDGWRHRVCIHDPDHIEEEIIPKTGAAVNTADVVLVGANISVAWVFGVSIAKDWAVIIWHRRKVRSLLRLRLLKGGVRP